MMAVSREQIREALLIMLVRALRDARDLLRECEFVGRHAENAMQRMRVIEAALEQGESEVRV